MLFTGDKHDLYALDATIRRLNDSRNPLAHKCFTTQKFKAKSASAFENATVHARACDMWRTLECDREGSLIQEGNPVLSSAAGGIMAWNSKRQTN